METIKAFLLCCSNIEKLDPYIIDITVIKPETLKLSSSEKTSNHSIKRKAVNGCDSKPFII